MKTIDQQIASAQDKLSRLRTKKKATDTRVKIIAGAVVVKAAMESPEAAAKLAAPAPSARLWVSVYRSRMA